MELLRRLGGLEMIRNMCERMRREARQNAAHPDKTAPLAFVVGGAALYATVYAAGRPWRQCLFC